jgi:regulator of sigma D
MTTEVPGTHSARPRSRNLIEDMLEHRRRMLVQLWELSTLDLENIDQTVKDKLETFLETLVDYIAAGHFSLYRRIVEGNERRQSVADTANEIYARIAATTDIAVDFSERYGTPENATIGDHLAADLSRLAEQVATRIELEDQLILAMLGDDYAIPEVRS